MDAWRNSQGMTGPAMRARPKKRARRWPDSARRRDSGPIRGRDGAARAARVYAPRTDWYGLRAILGCSGGRGRAGGLLGHPGDGI
jgi:hypothetical protein